MIEFVRDVWANKRCAAKIDFLRSHRQCRRRAMGWCAGVPFCSQHGIKLQRKTK